MSSRYPFLMALLLSLTTTAFAPAQGTGWAKKFVLTKKVAVTSTTDQAGKKPSAAPLSSPYYYVLKDAPKDATLKNGTNRLAVREGKDEVWFDKSDAVPLDDAVAYFSGRIDAAPGDALMWGRRALARELKTQYKKALDDYDRAVKSAPREPAWLVNRGRCRFKLELYSEAKNDFDAAIAMNPDLIEAYNGRGLCWQAQGQHEKALLDFLTVLNKLPADDPSGYNAFFWLLATWRVEGWQKVGMAFFVAPTMNLDTPSTNNPALIDTVAAAYAWMGEYPTARVKEAKAIELLKNVDRSIYPLTNEQIAERTKEYEARQKLYAAGSPYYVP